ncbi:SDR family NAD(P)-dependent oxidoreductase [Halobacillus sp. Marseille-Q1614]|uniref:SDR family NAD(P)-dependent oxidoreductase n=1 Tax=Halobacillus sp. Marseille-Q1614 TaxID=2709134 RepID=UPI0015712075|nr:SDR family NAD(P)-dependent oxidoreductase [Halobacillus sp. Marseille-Q1614]
MFFNDKKILVIGGTGTIGQRLVSTILEEDPKLVKIYSRDEYKQYQLLNTFNNDDRLQAVIGDVRDFERLHQSMQGIDYVFHLAAMKQVAMCEHNPYEAVKTNVMGTENVINAAIAQKVKKVVFTSSDKAISPPNAYGATKLIGEKLISSAEQGREKGQTIFASVRFGNVMGSRGSVIPLFKEQILQQKKITITDKDMTRFMMTLQQATLLTIKALKEAKGGEVFVLKMPVIKLEDLGSLLIEEICKKHGMDSDEISIELMGLRPGEKMYEELMTYDESLEAWELPDMFIIPGNASNSLAYHQAKKPTPGTYGSMEQDPLDIAQLRTLLKEAHLI